jgi:NACHT domain
MAAVQGRRWALVAAIGGLLVAGAAGYLVIVRITEGAQAADNEASVIAGILAAAGATAAILGWAQHRRRQASLPATAEQVDQAAATLAGAVREQWQAEAEARSLGDPEPMPVRWRLTSPNLMDHPQVITPDEPLSVAGSSDRIGPLTQAFRALPRRRLVITGGPGTGKTTLAVQLLLELLPPPGEPPSGPIPVLFSLVSWTPDSQPRVQDWLTTQLEQTYPALRAIAADAAAALVAQGRVLPILDGLDEVHSVRCGGIITALNTSLQPGGGLILTSRRTEYRTALADAGDVLTAAAVIGPLALTPTDAATFLRRHLPPAPHRPDWDRVLDALTGGSAPNLAAVTATPLGLWLIRTVYLDTRRPPGPLIDPARHPTAAALQAHLLDNLIPAVIHSRPPLPRRRRDAPDAPLRPTHQHRPEDLRRWLTTLAENLRAAGTRDWLWWELAQQTSPTFRSRLALRTATGLMVGLLAGLTAGLSAGRVLGPTGGLQFALTAGIPAGLLLGLAAPPRHASLRLSGRIPEFLRKLAGALLRVGLPSGGVLAVAIGVADGLAAGLAWGLAWGLGGGLAFGLTDFLGSSAVAERSTSPGLSYRGDRARSMIEFVAIGLMGGLATGLLIGGAVALMGGLAVGLAVGLPVGLVRGAWFAFVVAALQQTVRRPRRLPAPWRVMAVLDDAYRLGLLRTVGPAYQFRHAELQDHLAPPQSAPAP